MGDIFDEDKKKLAAVKARDKGNSDPTGRSRIQGSGNDGESEPQSNGRFGNGGLGRAVDAISRRREQMDDINNSIGDTMR